MSITASTISIQDLPVDLLVKLFEHIESHDLCTVQQGIYIVKRVLLFVLIFGCFSIFMRIKKFQFRVVCAC